jgi:alkylated DNA nucleotide flippase Atl1
MSPRPDPRSRADRVIARVRAIPAGFVRTYGDIDPSAPRFVGHVLSGLDGREHEDVPWHRVVRADGRAPIGAEQLRRLRREGVPVQGGRVDLARARLPRDIADWPL